MISATLAVHPAVASDFDLSLRISLIYTLPSSLHSNSSILMKVWLKAFGKSRDKNAWFRSSSSEKFFSTKMDTSEPSKQNEKLISEKTIQLNQRVFVCSYSATFD